MTIREGNFNTLSNQFGLQVVILSIMTLVPSRGILRPVAQEVKAKSRASCSVPTNLITLYWLMETADIRRTL